MRIVLYANTDWYLYNFRLSLALRLREQGHDLILISPAGSFGQRLAERGFDWRPLPMRRRSVNPFVELRLVYFLYRLFIQERVDIVHGFTIKPAVYGAIAGKLAGLRGRVASVAGLGYVFTSSDYRACFFRPLVRNLMKLAFAGDSTRVILQNPDDVRIFRDQSLVSVEHIRLIKGSGVDCARFSPVASSGESTPGLRVLFAARVLWDKGIGEYVEAARILRRKNVNGEFLVAGEPDSGNPAAVPLDQLAQWQREGVIEWLGHVEDMPSLYGSVDIVVLPSYREGLPKGLIEAAACALPIVATDVPGCREVVDHRENGLLVPPGDASALAEAIDELMGDSGLRVSLGQKARQKALLEFEESLVLSQTQQVYAEFPSG